MDVKAIIEDLNRLIALQAEVNRLAAQIPHATPEQREAIAQRLNEMQQEHKMVEGDRNVSH